ncbi:hypothetical protein E8E11_005160 [Didymella keratinophila]|nr:hypothetical protein E8E11_005160 [Didymella keratinophila]
MPWMYCGWLYTGAIHIDENVPRDSEDFGLRILKAYNLSGTLDDIDFQNAVAANYIAENCFAKRFWLTAVNFVFVELEDEDELDESDDENGDDIDCATNCTIDNFVIDNFIEVMDSRFFERHASMFPKLFVRRQSQRLLEKTLRPSRKDILDEYAGGEYEMKE